MVGIGLWFDKLYIQYALKLRCNPDNPANDVVFNSQFYELYDKKPSNYNFHSTFVAHNLSKRQALDTDRSITVLPEGSASWRKTKGKLGWECFCKEIGFPLLFE